MTVHRVPSLVALVCLLPLAVACGRVESAGTDDIVTVKLSTGSPTGNFRPFSEALARSYMGLMPDIRIQSIDTPGSVHNIAALHNGTIDIGLAQAGIAYKAYTGQLRESGPLRNIRGIAVLNSSEVHLMVGPGSKWAFCRGRSRPFNVASRRAS